MVLWVLRTIHVGTPLRARFDVALLRRMVRYGMKSHIQTIAAHFHFKADIYLIAYFTAPTEVAFYTIAARLAEHIMLVPQSLGLVLFPRLAGSDVDRAHALTASACRQTIVMTGGSALVLATLGRWLITTWYGEAYEPAATPLAYICTGIVMMSLYVLLSRNFTSRNKQAVNIFAAYVALLGNISLNLVLIPRYGITGAAISTAISYSTASLLLLVVFLRDSGLGLREVLLVKRTDIVRWRRVLVDLWAGLRPARA
jgi:O-antigen/teichoic acid export membrane protein